MHDLVSKTNNVINISYYGLGNLIRFSFIPQSPQTALLYYIEVS